MSLKKKIISLVAAAGLMASTLTMSGCSTGNVGVPLTVNGNEIPAGLYILFCGSAYGEAQRVFRDENPDTDTSAEDFDFHSQTVDGKAFDQYVKDKAIEYCVRHLKVASLYAEQGLKFSDDDKDNLADTVAAQWNCDLTTWTTTLAFANGYDTLGEYYEHIGVSKSSLKQYYEINQYKSSALFDAYYDKGGSKEVSDSEINDYVDKNYALSRYFAVSLKDDDGNVIEDKDKLAELEKLANGYAAELNGGKAYKDVYAEYQKYLNGSEESSSTNTEDEILDTDYDRVLSSDGTSPSEEFVTALFAQNKNSATVFKAEEYYYVVQKLDILTAEKDGKKYVDTYRSDALYGLKSDEYEEMLVSDAANQNVVETKGIPDYCKEQAENASNALSAVNTIQYMTYYYSSMLGGSY